MYIEAPHKPGDYFHMHAIHKNGSRGKYKNCHVQFGPKPSNVFVKKKSIC